MRLPDKMRTMRFALVALFAAGGLLVWGELAPVDGLVSFRVPKTLSTADGTIRRADIRSIRVVARDTDGEISARSEQDLDNGLQGPVTPPLFMRLPRGVYNLTVTIDSKRGPQISLPGVLSLDEAGYHRVELRRPR